MMMDVLSPGQIYLADQRRLTETDTYRRYSTFNKDDEHKASFGNLSLFNDEIIAAGQSVELIIEQDCYFILMPVTGMVMAQLADEHKGADAGQLLINYVEKGTVITLKNDYDNYWINLLYLQVIVDRVEGSVPQLINFDLTQKPDQLIKLLPAGLGFNMHIGLFSGRSDALHSVQSKRSKLFAFVLAGAFEFQGRLMHERDGLALWDFDEADMEALSNNAIVVLVEQY